MDSKVLSKKGHLHPISLMIREINAIFAELGFVFAEGPEMESVHYNFDLLNVPKDHPARDMQDTFYVDDATIDVQHVLNLLDARRQEAKTRNSEYAGSIFTNQTVSGLSDAGNEADEDFRRAVVMRTHTSPVQVRYMEKHEPPIRVIVPGKVFRNEATDATHEAQFYQLEGLMIDTDVSIGHLKGTLEYFFKRFFGGQVEVRLRPSFFPFVEPGLEVDMRLTGVDAPAKLKDRWIEIMGAGMVHPNVIRGAGIDPEKYQGFAFGMGIDRLAVMKYGVDDVRLFYNGDLRVVNQF